MTSHPESPVTTRIVEIRDGSNTWSVTASVITLARKEKHVLGHAVGLDTQLHVVLPGETEPDIYFLSRLAGERQWVQDAHFGPRGQPFFVHGFGSRVTGKHGIHLALEAVLDDAARQRELVTDIGPGVPLVLAGTSEPPTTPPPAPEEASRPVPHSPTRTGNTAPGTPRASS